MRNPMTNKELLQLQDTPEGRKVLGEYLAELTKTGVEYNHLYSFHTGVCVKCEKHRRDVQGKVGCTHVTPITIDDSDACMGMAVRMLNKIIENIGWREFRVRVDEKQNPIDFNHDLLQLIIAKEVFELLKIIALAIKEKPNGTE
jgi:hypothetical protein